MTSDIRQGIRGRREAARRGDHFAQLQTQNIIRTARAVRLDRVEDADGNPIGAYLTLLDWFGRWEELCLRRYYRGKPLPHLFEGETPNYGPAETRWGDQQEKLRHLRDKVLIEGCRLGASAIEMSRLLSEIDRAFRELGWWIEGRPPGEDEDEAGDVVWSRVFELDRRSAPLKDLHMWKVACEAGSAAATADGATPATEVPLEVRALEVFLRNPGISFTRLAKEVGCSRRRLYDLKRLMAAHRARQQGRADIPRGHRNADGSLEAFE